jgi:hypothetical protein
MDAKEFRFKNGKPEIRFSTEKRYVLYEAEEVERLMEQYHESKVNNVALDDVSYSVAQQYAEFCVMCDREELPLIRIEDYINQL